jgi:DNA-binding CsgD family transcriptional regulator
MMSRGATGWRGAPLQGRSEGAIAVTFRPAGTGETFDLLARAWSLSGRERQLVALIATGLDTRALFQRLFISPHTVQDHLKSVFTKVGVHGRRELLAQLQVSPDS